MMKKILCLGSFIAMILGATGCDRNNIEPEDKMVTKVLYAINSDTKTSLEGKDIVWEKGDTVCCIAVYKDNRLNSARYAVYSNIKPTEMNGSSARIEVTCGSAFTPAYIIYPTSDLVSYTSDGQLTIPVSESYTMVKDNIPYASNIAVGTVEQDNVYMKNAMALMKFEVAYPEGMNEEIDGIKQIVVSSNAGEALSGTMTYDPAENKVTVTEGSSKLYLYPPTDEPYFPAGVYYFPLPSISLSQGLKVKVSRGDNWVATKSYEQAYDLKRSSIINMGKTSDWGLNYENTVRTLKAVFSKDGAKVGTGWAFDGTEPKKATVCGKGLVGPYYLPDNDDAPFYFFVAKEVSSDSWRTTGGAGRRFGGTVHDYMLLPAINGYRLASVYIKSGSGASTYAITNNPASGDPVPVAGGEKKSISKQSEHTFILSGTEADTAYRLDLPTTTCAGILEFQLNYEME